MAAVLAAGLCFAQLQPRPGWDSRSGLAGNFVRLEGGLVVNEDELQTECRWVLGSAGFVGSALEEKRSVAWATLRDLLLKVAHVAVQRKLWS